MAKNKNIIFSAAVRVFHVYKASCKPKEDELLECSHEKDNPYDSFSIKIFKPDSPPEIVGHLPLEISQITKFVINRGVQVQHPHQNTRQNPHHDSRRKRKTSL